MNKTFDYLANKYDIRIKKTIPEYPKICHYIAKCLKGSNKILDAGCGTGTIGLLLAEQGSHVTCIDASQKMLDKAKEKVKCRDLEDKFTFKKVKIEELNYNKKFDGLSCNFILYFTNREDAIHALIKSIKRNGKIVITDICPTNSFRDKFLKYLFKLSQFLNDYPIADFWSTEETLSLLKKEKLINLKVRQISSTAAGFPIGFTVGFPVVIFTAKKA